MERSPQTLCVRITRYAIYIEGGAATIASRAEHKLFKHLPVRLHDRQIRPGLIVGGTRDRHDGSGRITPLGKNINRFYTALF